MIVIRAILSCFGVCVLSALIAAACIFAVMK